MSRRMRFLGAVALQFLLLCSVIGYKQYTVVTGTTVVLLVEPLDPRSLFRGDYVRLNYTVSTLNLNEVGGDDFFGYDQTVYVELAPAGSGTWEALSISRDRREVTDGHVMIKGRTADIGSVNSRATVRLRYGIEEVFIPEGSGRDVERAGNRVSVEVKVDRFGNAVPRRILLDGEPFKLKRR